MSELAHHGTDYEVVEGEPADLLGRNLNAAAHLLASASAFFFLAFVFAYFYLRSLDNGGMWHPKHVDPSTALGVVITATVVASAVVVRLAVADQRAERAAAWRLKAGIGLLLGVGAVLLQIVEWATIGFGPTEGGYASVFFGWTAFYALFVLGAMFWLETLVATAIRYRHAPVREAAPPPGEASGDSHRAGHDVADSLSLVRPGLEALSFYWGFLAGLGVLAWIILYLL